MEGIRIQDIGAEAIRPQSLPEAEIGSKRKKGGGGETEWFGLTDSEGFVLMDSDGYYLQVKR